MARTIGELISETPDLRREYPPIKLSDQPVPLTLKELAAMVAGPVLALLLVIVIAICAALVIKADKKHQAEIRERREKIMQQHNQEYMRNLNQRRKARFKELCVARTYEQMGLCELKNSP